MWLLIDLFQSKTIVLTVRKKERIVRKNCKKERKRMYVQ